MYEAFVTVPDSCLGSLAKVLKPVCFITAKKKRRSCCCFDAVSSQDQRRGLRCFRAFFSDYCLGMMAQVGSDTMAPSIAGVFATHVLYAAFAPGIWALCAAASIARAYAAYPMAVVG